MYFSTIKLNERSDDQGVIYDEDTTGNCFFIVQKGKL